MLKVYRLALTAGCLIHLGCGAAPQDTFWSALHTLCGNAYRGTLITGTAPADSTFANNEMIMHVRECSESEVRIPFHVGEDRSRTWIITRTAAGLRLKHEHHHEDGAPSDITMYGGDTRDEGTAALQRFHADSVTARLDADAVTNVWSIELVPGERFAYGLVREATGRTINIAFDLSATVPAPPPPWGS